MNLGAGRWCTRISSASRSPSALATSSATRSFARRWTRRGRAEGAASRGSALRRRRALPPNPPLRAAADGEGSRRPERCASTPCSTGGTPRAKRDRPPPRPVAKAAEIGAGEVATVVGRYYTMDRDNRWDASSGVQGDGPRRGCALRRPRGRRRRVVRGGEGDEFIEPVVISRTAGRRTDRHRRLGDLFNFRGDRAREITRALTQETFDRFPAPSGSPSPTPA